MKVDEVRRTVPGPIGSSIRYLPTVTSTNDYLIDLERPTQGYVLVTDLQSAGRGRGSRRWEAPAGENLLFSVALSIGVSESTLSLLPLLVCVGVCEGIEALGIGGIETKWPNDIIFGDRKLGGILIESRFDGQTARIVAGVGLNVNQRTFPAELSSSATSLAEISGAPVNRELLLGKILDGLNHCIFAREHADAICRYRERCSTIGREVTFESAGRKRLGRAVDVDDSGRLLVDEEGTTYAYSGSEVTHVRSIGGDR